MFGSKTLKATLIGTSALVAVTVMVAPTPARALPPPCSPTTTVSTTDHPSVNLCAGASLTVTSAGSITGSPGALVNHVTAGSVSNSGHISVSDTGIRIENTGALTGGISNSGTIHTTSGSGIELSGKSTVNGGISNTGHITSHNTGIGIYNTSTVNGGISNSGIIHSTNDAGFDIWTKATISGGISNIGEIEGTWAGIGVGDHSTIAGGITNSGIIIATNNAANDAAINLRSATVTGGIHNSGTISGTKGHGIELRSISSVTGGITNSGTIHGKQTGILIKDKSTVTGGITNSGHITSTSNYGIELDTTSSVAGGITNSAGGVIFGGGDAGIALFDKSTVDKITNAGTISSANSEGIFLDTHSAVTGGIVNSGTINANDVGILLERTSTVAGGIVNSGTINAHNSYGIKLETSSSVAGGITNSGTITSESAGIYIEDNSTVDFINNSGHINSTSSKGIWIESGSSVTGGITNSGHISASDTGIRIESGTVGGGITNSGTIQSKDESGIELSNASTVDFIKNSGHILAPNSRGIELTGTSHITGGITNTGTISARDTGIELSSASTVVGGITNSGTIKGGSDPGILLSGGSTVDAITNNSGGSIIGTYGIRVESSRSGGPGTSSGNAFIGHFGNISGGVTNAGTISGVTSVGIAVNSGSDISGGITNSGTIKGHNDGIQVTGSLQTGFGTSTSLITHHSDISGGVTNTGTISGGSTGISIAQKGDISGGILNHGTIKGGNFGIHVASSGSDISGGVDNFGHITGHSGITVTSSANLSGGITNEVGGVIEGTTGTAISLNGLSVAAPITLLGGQIIGNVTDNNWNSGNDRSPVTVGGAFATGGNFQVSDLILPATGNLTISSGNTFTSNIMTGSTLNAVGHNGTLTFGVASTLSHGFLTVTNAPVNLTKVTVAADVQPAGLVSGDKIEVATGNAAIVGGPGAVFTTIADSNYFWNVQMVNGLGAGIVGTADQLWLVATQAHTLAGTASTGNNLSIGNILNSPSVTDPTLLEIQDNLNEATSADQVNSILSSAGPTVDGSDLTAATDVSNETLDLVDTELASLRTGEDSSTGMAAGNMAHGFGAWGQVFGQHADQTEREGFAGFNSNTWGGAVGVDTKNISDTSTVGVALSYGRTNAHSKDANTTDTTVDSYQGTLYGDIDLARHIYLNGMAGYTFGKDDTVRHDVGGVGGLDAHGNFNTHTISARAEAGRDFDQNGTLLTPNILAQWVDFNPDAYTETGANGADLHVDGKTLNIWELGGGLKAGWSFKNHSGSWIKPQVHATYRYNFGDTQVQDTTAFTGGGGSFLVAGPHQSRSTVNLGAAVKLLTVSNWSLTADYNFDWKTDYTSHSGFLRAGYKF